MNDPSNLRILNAFEVSYGANLKASDVVENIQIISRSRYAIDKLFDIFPAELQLTDNIRTSLLEIVRGNFLFLKTCDASAIKSLFDCQCIPVYCDLFVKEKKKIQNK